MPFKACRPIPLLFKAARIWSRPHPSGDQPLPEPATQSLVLMRRKLTLFRIKRAELIELTPKWLSTKVRFKSALFGFFALPGLS